MFQKVLIANRGEIAVRVIRACRDLGIRTVAVYSDADRASLHVRYADEAYWIGPSPSAESYLNMERVLEVAARSGSDAVHPGYGFLSENPAFARATESAGLTFVGPSEEAISVMGSKLASRNRVTKAGIPIVPGSLRPIRSDREARKIADEVGFPLMLKATAGGGGKGMRKVESPSELGGALDVTRSEALAAFGDEEIYIEKFVARPRHIEVQVVADRSGNAVHLGERECTIQRRHQKVIEEAPSPVVDKALREAMGEAALGVARAVAYDNLGTVEFLFDDALREFYFLEMNTRIQVEHAVTEAVTGIDLVVEQLRIAAGLPLSISQDEVRLHGAAIECRIYAEDPARGFLPSPGRIERLEVPSGPGVRDDSGVFSGWEVPLEYDPLLSKLIVWGSDRDHALNRMRRALTEYQIDGIRSNLSFFREVLADPDFVSGRFDTGFVDSWLESRVPESEQRSNRDLAVLAAAVFASGMAAPRERAGRASTESNWKLTGRREHLRES